VRAGLQQVVRRGQLLEHPELAVVDKVVAVVVAEDEAAVRRSTPRRPVRKT